MSYKVKVTDSLGISTTLEAPIIVEVVYDAQPPKRNPQFTASAVSVVAGTPVTLTWSDTDGASALYVNGQPVTGPRGAMSVMPNATTTYTLHVVYPDESIDRSITINVTAPPIVSARIGVNCLFDGSAARDAYSRGCRFFLMMNDTDTANWLCQQPDVLVMYRQYFDHAPSVQEAMTYLQAPRLHPLVIRTGINECEFIDGNNIQSHAAFDIELAQALKSQDSRIRYAAGTYSMGTPDFTNPAICDAIRQYYAPAYNSGLIWWDHHLYSPNMGHVYQTNDVIWYETRWEMLFTKCGFDPTIAHIVSGETGMDEGGVGGFPAHNATPNDVVKWCNEFLEIQGQQFVGGAIFQLGDTQRWGGYNVASYLPALQSEVWA